MLTSCYLMQALDTGRNSAIILDHSEWSHLSATRLLTSVCRAAKISHGEIRTLPVNFLTLAICPLLIQQKCIRNAALRLGDSIANDNVALYTTTTRASCMHIDLCISTWMIVRCIPLCYITTPRNWSRRFVCIILTASGVKNISYAQAGHRWSRDPTSRIVAGDWFFGAILWSNMKVLVHSRPQDKLTKHSEQSNSRFVCVPVTSLKVTSLKERFPRSRPEASQTQRDWYNENGGGKRSIKHYLPGFAGRKSLVLRA